MKRLSARIPGDEGRAVIGHILDLGRTTDGESSRYRQMALLPYTVVALPCAILARAKAARDEFDGKLIKIWLVHQLGVFPFTGEMLQVMCARIGTAD